MNVITITGYRRPALFAALIDSLAANDLGGWRLNIQIEPSDQADVFGQIATEKLGATPLSLRVNRSVLGIRENPFELLDRTFDEGAPLVLYLEEDLLVAPDATRLASWYAGNHRPEWLMLSLISGGCGSAGYISDKRHSSVLFEGKSFNSLGFACRREEWRGQLRDAWHRDLPINTNFVGGPAPGWDWAIYHHLVRTRGCYSLQPAAARAVHTGREGGEFCKPDWHDLVFAGLDIATELSDTDSYQVLPSTDLPPSVRRQALMWEQMNQALEVLGSRTAELALVHAQNDRWRQLSLLKRLRHALKPR